MPRRRLMILVAITLTAGLTAATCGGNSAPSSPSPSPGPAPAPAPNPSPTEATVTIGAGGVVSPKILTVTPGTRVTFINNDSRAHDMSSDPHPTHTDCPEINQAGFLTPGQSRQTGNLNTRRTCGFHDHISFSDTNLMGRIVIQ